MIRMVPITSAEHAKKYFAAELSISDYYVNDQELQGHFKGRLAERLGVSGPATKDAFFALCDNRQPVTNQPLTQRTKEDRITGYDVNFHCPKSLSCIHALVDDNHILKAFEASVDETMKEIEADAKTRVRKKNTYDDRTTGELIWGSFTHQTARPVDGHLPDPHLHSHNVIFNATWDDKEKQYKAGKFYDMKRDMPYYQARFHKRLADKMIDLGYRVRRTDHAFEIEGVPQKVIDHFSKRTDHIGRVAKEKGITDTEMLAELGAMTRGKKQNGLTMTELKAEWRRQMQELGPDKDAGSGAVRYAVVNTLWKNSPKECVDHALQHCFERASVMEDRYVMSHAYRHAIGDKEVSLEGITSEFRQDQRILHFKQGSRTLSTTKAVLQEEQRMVTLARAGEGQLAPMYRLPPELSLKEQQATAALDVLTSTDRVSIIMGRAGVGKTTMMKELVGKIEATGRQVIMLAPTAEASRGELRSEGFKEAETVAKFLGDQDARPKLKGNVIVCDEAGLLGTTDMTALLEIATRNNARLLLCGDTRQHSAVVRGDALRILNTVGGIRASEIGKIRRQKNAQYRAAVEDLSQGNAKDAFAKLDAMAAIKTVDPTDPSATLVNDYVAALKKKKSALVISPTHKQGDETTDAIRKKLRSLGMIGKKEIKARRYSNTNYTEAEKSDWRNYKKGQAIQFNRWGKGFKKGSAWSVKSVADNRVVIEDADGKTALLPRQKSSSFDVFHVSEIGVSKGDKVRITRGGEDDKKKRLDNGMALEVTSVSKKGEIILRNRASKAKYVLKQDFGHIAHAHVVTSHASQGKTVDEVFIAQPSATFQASDMKQFYVSVSRGKEGVNIYTDDKTALLEHVSQIGDRQSALQTQAKHLDHVVARQRIEDGKANPKLKPRDKAPSLSNHPKIDRDYEPTI